LEELVQHGLAKVSAERVPSALAYITQLDDIARRAGVQPRGLAITPPQGSASLMIPVGPHAPLAAATPMPFFNEIGTAPTATSLTPAPAPLRAAARTISVAESGAAIPRK